MKHHREPYRCTGSQHLYDNYYQLSQSGGNMPMFSGARTQRGYGIGSILGGLFCSDIPLTTSSA